MTLTEPYPPELIQIARKVVWFDAPEQTLTDLQTFLAHLIVYGSPRDVAVVQLYVPEEEFRKVLEEAPPGVFTNLSSTPRRMPNRTRRIPPIVECRRYEGRRHADDDAIGFASAIATRTNWLRETRHQ